VLDISELCVTQIINPLIWQGGVPTDNSLTGFFSDFNLSNYPYPSGGVKSE